MSRMPSSVAATTTPAPPEPGATGREFVALVATLMAVSALAMDMMLPALPDIAGAFGSVDPNDRQLIVTTFIAGLAAGKAFYGPLSDRFGRKPMLILGLGLYAIGAGVAIVAPSYGALLAARVLQGFGAAAARVVTLAMVRDRHSGSRMARIMSFAMMVSIIVPIMAPALGQIVLLVGTWRWIFAFFIVAAFGALAWMTARLPETCGADRRHALSAGALLSSLRRVLASRRAVGYTAAMGLMGGMMASYLGCAQQIFVDLYGLGERFPLVFGALSGVLGLSAYVNARLVGRFGMHRLAALALGGYVAACGASALLGFPGAPTLPLFSAYMAVLFFCFGLMMTNFSALAMEPLGGVAGMAASFIGLCTAGAGVLLGWLIGQAFDGGVRPLQIGFAALGLGAVVAVLVAEWGARDGWARPRFHRAAGR